MKIPSHGIAPVNKQVPRMAPATAFGIQIPQFTKTRLGILPILALCSALATTAAFGQATQIWTGGGDRTNIDLAANWGGTLPSTANNDTAEWDGLTTSNLFLINNTTAFASGPGNSGINLYLTGNQTNSINIDTSLAVGQGFAVYNVTMDSGAGSLSLGGTNSAHLFYMPQRPSGAIHNYMNNSANPGIINPRIRYISGGGAAYTLEFGGTGNWNINNYLQPDNNGGAASIQVDGPGVTTWTPSGYFGSDSLGTITITGGTLVLAGPHSKLTTRPIAVEGTFQFNAPSQAQTLSGVISGGGAVQVSNGSLTLSGQSTYSGNTILSGGELIVNRAETEGVSGPLGLGGTISFNGGTLKYGVNNTFDYSPRFSTAAGQLYKFDTAGQLVTLTNALASNGGTLTKLGSGTLTLSGTNSYSGLTTVNGGKLVFQGVKTGSANITVANSAALGVTENGSQITPAVLTVGTTGGATLEFNDVSSTTTAPLAAVALSTGGPVTVNVNGGTFVAGQSYPLLTWTTGTPTFNLGIVIGAIGNLQVVGNTLQLNVTALSYVWTGATDGKWDLATMNWLFNASPAAFVNGGGALFDDTATGVTNVTLNAPVSPAGVTINNNIKSYSIASSGANLIGGTGGLTKANTGTTTLSGGVNTYSGASTLIGGTLSVGALANGGSPSDIGASSSSAANLVLNGGGLQYTGGGASMDRLFALGTAGGTIDNAGSGALVFNNTGSLDLIGAGARTLTLTGTNPDANTLAATLADNGGATSLTKNGEGKWVLTGNNTYSGVTTIANGILQIGVGGAGGALGTGSVLNNGALDFNVSGTLTVGAINGTGVVTNDGPGTVILAGDNGYSGGTYINAGTVQFGTGGVTGTIFGNAPIVDNGTLIFNTTSPINISGFNNNISGTGNVIVRAGFVTSTSGNTYTGWTEVDSGATFQPCGGQTGGMLTSVITNNGTLKFVSQNTPPTFGITNNIVGTGRVWMDTGNQNAGQAVLAGTNTYTGGTFIGGGGIVLGDGITPGAGTIVGSVVFTNTTGPTVETFSANKRLLFNHADDFTFTNNIISAVSDGSSPANSGSLEQQGPGAVTLTGNNSYPGDTTVAVGALLQVGNGGTSGSIGTGNVPNEGTLVFNRSDSVTLSNVISGGGSIVKAGSGTLTLAATNTYTGTTTVSNGTLIVNGDNAASSTIVYAGTLGGTGAFLGPVSLEAGTTLAPGAPVGTLTMNSDLTIGGNIAIDINKSLPGSNDLVTVAGALSKTGTGTLTVANLGPALAVGEKFTVFSQPLTGGAGLTVTGGGATWANNLATDGSITVLTVSQTQSPTLAFTNVAGGLQFSWTGSFKLQAQTNSLNVGLSSNWGDYPGGGTSPVTAPIGGTNGAVFFRLVSTP